MEMRGHEGLPKQKDKSSRLNKKLASLGIVPNFNRPNKLDKNLTPGMSQQGLHTPAANSGNFDVGFSSSPSTRTFDSALFSNKATANVATVPNFGVFTGDLAGEMAKTIPGATDAINRELKAPGVQRNNIQLSIPSGGERSPFVTNTKHEGFASNVSDAVKRVSGVHGPMALNSFNTHGLAAAGKIPNFQKIAEQPEPLLVDTAGTAAAGKIPNFQKIAEQPEPSVNLELPRRPAIADHIRAGAELDLLVDTAGTNTDRGFEGASSIARHQQHDTDGLAAAGKTPNFKKIAEQPEPLLVDTAGTNTDRGFEGASSIARHQQHDTDLQRSAAIFHGSQSGAHLALQRGPTLTQETPSMAAAAGGYVPNFLSMATAPPLMTLDHDLNKQFEQFLMAFNAQVEPLLTDGIDRQHQLRVGIDATVNGLIQGAPTDFNQAVGGSLTQEYKANPFGGLGNGQHLGSKHPNTSNKDRGNV